MLRKTPKNSFQKKNFNACPLKVARFAPKSFGFKMVHSRSFSFNAPRAMPVAKVNFHRIQARPTVVSVLPRSLPRTISIRSVTSMPRPTLRPQLVLHTPYLQTSPRLSSPSFSLPAPRLLFSYRSFSSGPAPLSKAEVTERVIDCIKNFEKIDGTMQVTAESHFINDLGLDSLDVVEIGLALEETFSIEIPDQDAESLHTVGDCITYILNHPHAK